MTPKTKKGLMVVVPILVAGTIIYLLNKKKKPKELLAATDADVKDTPAPVVKVTSVFPLKKGSRNEQVRDLQRIIGVEADGIFGSDTENALINFGGVRVVNSQKELDALKNKSIGISSAARANDLVAKWKQGTVSMYVISPATAELVTIDAFGAVQYSGKFKTFAGGKTYNRNDYELTSSTKLGKLLFTINKGALAGTYMVDPNLISLK